MSDQAVQRWLLDKREPTPSAPELAAFFARQMRMVPPFQAETREAMLALARLVVELDGLRRGAAEAGVEMMKQRDHLHQQLHATQSQMRGYASMLQDVGHTARIQGQKLAEIDPLVRAAVDGDDVTLKKEVKKQRQAQEKRS